MNDLAAITIDELRQAREGLARPTHLAEGLPGHFYGPSFFALEQETLFASSWCAVSVASALPNPGDVLPIDLVGWPIILVRGRDNEVRAFHNICRHRAMRPVAEACNTRLIRCPWHSWAYDLEGKLLTTPEIGGAKVNAIEGFDKSDLGLKPIPVGRWLDYVFVNLDGTAPPFAEHIAPAEALFADLDLNDMRHGARLDETYEGNWKLFVEGFIEDYHLPCGHPQLQPQTFRNTTPCIVAGVYAGGWMSLGGEGDATDAPPPMSSADLPLIQTNDGMPSSRMLVLTLFPTGMILMGVDELMIGLLMPDGPSRTKVQLNCYYLGEAATSAEAKAGRERNLEMWGQVIQQDFPFVIGAQATVAARDRAGIKTRFSPYWEEPVHRFQQMVIEAIDRPAAAGS